MRVFCGRICDPGRGSVSRTGVESGASASLVVYSIVIVALDIGCGILLRSGRWPG